MTNAKRIRRISSLLGKAYGRPGALRKTDPVDELVRTVLSQNTSDVNSLRAFSVLKDSFKSWNSLLEEDARHIAVLIKHAGLANIKARRLKNILTEIKRREGKISLTSLKRMSVKDTLAYLQSMKGVGPKTAACVALFSFGKPAMPVDTHIFRVTKRLGLIHKDTDIVEAHETLSGIVPKGLIYEFHLGIIEHGRRTCKALHPRCGECVLYKLCDYDKKS